LTAFSIPSVDDESRDGLFQPPTALSPEFFCRPAQEVAPELIGCLLLKRQVGGALLGGVIVETEASAKQYPPATGIAGAAPVMRRCLGSLGIGMCT